MKANAPEKVWVTDGWARQFNDKDFMGEDSIEYIRKDAFIEKACKWLEAHSPFVNDDILDVWLDNFKEAMKL